MAETESGAPPATPAPLPARRVGVDGVARVDMAAVLRLAAPLMATNATLLGSSMFLRWRSGRWRSMTL